MGQKNDVNIPPGISTRVETNRACSWNPTLGGHSSQGSPSRMVTALGPNSASTGATFAAATSATDASREMHKPLTEQALFGENFKTA